MWAGARDPRRWLSYLLKAHLSSEAWGGRGTSISQSRTAHGAARASRARPQGGGTRRPSPAALRPGHPGRPFPGRGGGRPLCCPRCWPSGGAGRPRGLRGAGVGHARAPGCDAEAEPGSLSPCHPASRLGDVSSFDGSEVPPASPSSPDPRPTGPRDAWGTLQPSRTCVHLASPAESGAPPGRLPSAATWADPPSSEERRCATGSQCGRGHRQVPGGPCSPRLRWQRAGQGALPGS